MEKRIIVIGGGVIGCAMARLLSRYEAKVTVLEGGEDVAHGASKANSGIVHAGFDAKPGSLKAKLNVEGARMYPELCKEVDAPYGQPGAMVLAFSQEERATVQELYKQGEQNGVAGQRIIEKDEILKLEPNVNPNVVCALLEPMSGLTSPYELTCALADHAAVNGATFVMNAKVQTIEKNGDGFALHTTKGEYTADLIVNCAGVFSAELHNQLSEKKLHIIPRKGEYYLLDHQKDLLFTMTMFQTPTKMGKGILVSPTVHGNTLLGPSADDIEDGTDVSTTAAALKIVNEKARLTWPGLSLRTVVTTFAGVRAHEENGDFIIGATEGVQGSYETIGIESPGLSAAPAIAKLLTEQIISENGLAEKKEWKPAPKREKPFYAMTLEERVDVVKRNPEYGALVCRCEQVTEAEIRAAIRRPVGATTIDGVKRRTRAGMGRCQGGFCSPRVLEILSEELGVAPTEVTKCGGESRILTGTIAQSMHKGDA
ncbi:MAG: NAD(P)/FAD-dependent oxidoreductase [Eubacteriales bacterium]|nr:NAD(P)/FAD-dependent oxidoreductase [Eubacteriales bacterium]